MANARRIVELLTKATRANTVVWHEKDDGREDSDGYETIQDGVQFHLDAGDRFYINGIFVTYGKEVDLSNLRAHARGQVSENRVKEDKGLCRKALEAASRVLDPKK